MPVYEYRCKSCGKTHEIEHGFHDKRPTECPSCGGELVRVFHPIGLVFKGSGFHKTDYGGASVRSGSSGSGDSGGDAKPADSKGGGEAKPSESKPSESKQSDGKSDTKSSGSSSSST
jgi:putative FmdB family regulatory protein